MVARPSRTRNPAHMGVFLVKSFFRRKARSYRSLVSLGKRGLDVSVSLARVDMSPFAVGQMASARRGSRMRSTGGAGVREAHVLDARLVVSPKILAGSELRIGQCRIDQFQVCTASISMV